MKKLATLFTILICSLAAQAQIPNASFENWTTNGPNFATPDGWDNFNQMTAGYMVYTCEKGTTGAPHGNAFLMLTTKVIGSSTVPGLALTGAIDPVSLKPKSGIPFTSRPAYLTGKWKYAPAGIDSPRVAVYLSRWNPTTGTRDMIVNLEKDLPGSVTSWTSFSIPLPYVSGLTPDTAIIGFTSSNRNHTAGSYLYIDSLNFAGIAVGLSENNNAPYTIKLSPNPASDKLSIDFGTAVSNDVKLSLIDMYGRTIRQAAWPQGKQVYSMPLEAVPHGLYLVRITAGNDTQTLRLVVQ